jgi:hypothetical protein
MKLYRLHSLTRALITGALLVSVASSAIAAEPARSSVSRVWDTAEDFDQCYRNRYLDSLSEPGSLKLVARTLVADEMGAGYNDFQEIQGKTLAKKILWLDNAGASDAVLIVDGTVNTCDILVNGTVLGAQPMKKTYWDANFESYPLPPRLLKAGTNEIVFRAHGNAGRGSIRVERSEQPNRSAVSHDGGDNWDFDDFGEGGYINGELGVRLSLGRCAPQAWIMSPVIDLAASSLQDGIPTGTNGRIDAVTVDALTPPGAAVQVTVRTGSTPDGDAATWSPWHPWQPRGAALQFDRFAQWRLELKSSPAGATPVVRRVAMQYSSVPATGTESFKSVKLVEDANQQIVRSSYDFAYANYNGNSRILRDRWKLASVISGGDSEMARFKALRQWVRNQWLNGWDKGALQYIPSWDARVILSLAPDNLSLGMCTHYATTFVQCAQALGIPARSVFRGHALSEVWSNDYKKWIVMDAGLDSNDKRRATYNFERNGIPLGELEAQLAWHDPKQWSEIRVVATNMSEGSPQVEPAFAPAPLGRDFESVAGQPPEMFLPLRNNFVDHREPEEPEHGEGYFKFLGHLYWKSQYTPDIRWTDFFTTREADINWTLNQAQIHLWRQPNDDGTMQAMLDTVTPNFTGYEVRVDGREWVTWSPAKGTSNPALAMVKGFPAHPTGACVSWQWKLHPGRNTIEAHPFNAAGLRGITSRLVVYVEPR